MIHSMIFTMVLSLGLGVWSIAVAWHQSARYGLPFLRYLIVFLVALNAVTVIGIFKNYYGENLGAVFTPQTGWIVDTAYRFLANIALFFIGGSLIFMLRALVDDVPSRLYARALILVWAAVFFAFVLGIRTTPSWSPLPLTVIANVALDQLVQLVVLCECARALIGTAHISQLARRKWTRLLLYVFGVVWLSMMSVSYLMFAGETGSRLFNLLSSVFYVTFNALPLAFLGSFLRRAHGPAPAVTHDVREALEELCSRFDISKRERDVVRLLCKGYANKKIAEELHISLSTVKDHNHNIFRKLGVSSRTELVALLVKQ